MTVRMTASRRFSAFKRSSQNMNTRPIEGHAEYLVSDCGNVISLKWGKHRVLRPNCINGGYLQVKLDQKMHLIHVLVARAFLGARPPDREVNHKDGNKANCAASNLEYVTHGENVKHAFATGLAE